MVLAGSGFYGVCRISSKSRHHLSANIGSSLLEKKWVFIVESYISADQLKQGEDALTEGAGCEDKEPYVLMVLGDSMEPEFLEGDVVVIEPGAYYRDGSYVIAWHNEEYILRQLRAVNDKLFITPLNPKYVSEELSGPEAIKGVITQRKRPGNRRDRKNYD